MQKDVTISWGTFDHGRSLVGIHSSQINATSFACERGVLLKAAVGNGGTVYVGNSDVTAGDNVTTDGYELTAGESVFIEINNVNKIYAIASAEKQSLYYVAV